MSRIETTPVFESKTKHHYLVHVKNVLIGEVIYNEGLYHVFKPKGHYSLNVEMIRQIVEFMDSKLKSL